MTLKEAHLLALKVLKQVMEEKLDQHNVQLAEVSSYLRTTFSPRLLTMSSGHDEGWFQNSR